MHMTKPRLPEYVAEASIYTTRGLNKFISENESINKNEISPARTVMPVEPNPLDSLLDAVGFSVVGRNDFQRWQDGFVGTSPCPSTVEYLGVTCRFVVYQEPGPTQTGGCIYKCSGI